MPLELYKTHSSLTCTCSLKPGPQRAISRTLALAAPDSGGHAVPCRVSGLRPWGWGKGTPQKPSASLPACQENPARLSDQQEAVSQGQNPYPIYASINVRTNISGEDFAGAWAWGTGKKVEAVVGRGGERPVLRMCRREPWSPMGLLPPALGKSSSCSGTRV